MFDLLLLVAVDQETVQTGSDYASLLVSLGLGGGTAIFVWWYRMLRRIDIRTTTGKEQDEEVQRLTKELATEQQQRALDADGYQRQLAELRHRNEVDLERLRREWEQERLELEHQVEMARRCETHERQRAEQSVERFIKQIQASNERLLRRFESTGSFVRADIPRSGDHEAIADTKDTED